MKGLLHHACADRFFARTREPRPRRHEGEEAALRYQRSRLVAFLLISDRLRSSGRHEYSQYGGNVANVSRNRHQCFRYGCVLFRQSLKTHADIVELIDFVQNRFKSHGYTAL
jgi:hypothetical protein